MAAAGILTLLAGDKGLAPYGDNFVEWPGGPGRYSDTFRRLTFLFKPGVGEKLPDRIVCEFQYMGHSKLAIPLIKIRLPSGVVIFDAALGGKHIPLGIYTTFHNYIFLQGTTQVADATQIARSFAIARFYVQEAHKMIEKKADALIHLPSLPTNKIVDPGRLMAGQTEVKVATAIAWLPGQSVWAHNIEYLRFKDALSEEVMIYFCGGRRVFHTGALALTRLSEWSATGPLPRQTSFRSVL